MGTIKQGGATGGIDIGEQMPAGVLAIVLNPKVITGKPMIRATRITVELILGG
jgi:hypothetical protein